MARSLSTLALLVALTALAACGGSGGGNSTSAGQIDCAKESCAPEIPTDGSVRCGLNLKACPSGTSCVATAGSPCDPLVSSDCPGLCQPSEVLDPECNSDADCEGTLRCYDCPDGTQLCPIAACAEGTCVYAIPDCPAPPPPPSCGGRNGAGCPDGMTCVDDPSDACAEGPAADCAGICVPKPYDRCTSDSECPVVGAPCTLCADGSYSCPKSFCDAGQCSIAVSPCSEAKFCGGIAGFPCDDGFTCIDDPADDCSPEKGGADCGGICVPDRPKPMCGGIEGIPCPPGLECSDDPSDACDPATGADCGGICRPAIDPVCKDDSECPQLKAPCSVCADGTAACPSSHCVDGRCNVEFPTCPLPPGCQSNTDCKPGYICGYDPRADCAPDPAVCPRVCVADERPRACGGFAGDVCAPGFHCTDDPSDECALSMGGADCPGICEPDQTNGCSEDTECPVILAPCALCPDGSAACPRSWCENGQCRATIDRCPAPASCGGSSGVECPPGFECVASDAHLCDPATGVDCGVCVPSPPPAQCKVDDDCPELPIPCPLCADGSSACGHTSCLNGQCVPTPVRCPRDNFCGGIAGIPCPDGNECIDDPNDDCDPANGGADCGGICIPAKPEPNCAADSDCAVIASACLLCPDGTASCATAACVNGQCVADFPGCRDIAL